MGLVTLHLVIGVGVFILPLFLLLFSYKGMSLATLYIMIGSISFVTSVITTIVLVTKFINQPAAHGFFSYSDTIASALMSLGLLLDGVIALVPTVDTPCYQYKLVYGLFVVPIVTGFFSVLGMAIERFQAFAVYRDHRHVTRKFSIAWFMSSWTLAVCFVVILVAQISEVDDDKVETSNLAQKADYVTLPRNVLLASQLFPGPHSEPIPVPETLLNKKQPMSSTEVLAEQINSKDIAIYIENEETLTEAHESTTNSTPANQNLENLSPDNSLPPGNNLDTNNDGTVNSSETTETKSSMNHEDTTTKDTIGNSMVSTPLSVSASVTVPASSVPPSTVGSTVVLGSTTGSAQSTLESTLNSASTSASAGVTLSIIKILSLPSLETSVPPLKSSPIIIRENSKALSEKGLTAGRKKRSPENKDEKYVSNKFLKKYFRYVSPTVGPNSNFSNEEDEIIECGSEVWNGTDLRLFCSPVKEVDSRSVIPEPEELTTTVKSRSEDDPMYAGLKCRVSSQSFVSYYFILLFLLCFATPVLITTSLNVFITSAVKNTHHEIISHHQWLTLAACVVMWGPCLTELLLAKWELVDTPKPLSIFLFLLGHTHNLLRSILHAVFAQQMSSFARRGFFTNQFKVNWGKEKQTKVTPISEEKAKVQKFNENMEIPIKRKDTLVPRPPVASDTYSPPFPRRSTIPNLQVIETTCT